MVAETDRETEDGQTGIFILTTTGPARVLRLAEEDPESQSIVCLNRSSTDVLQISGDYHRFVVKPSGVVQRLTGHGSYRLDVSAPIDAGKSWQLGIYAAHALKLRGQLQESDSAPATSLFLTGELAADLSVRDVEGIATKIAEARPCIDGLQAASGKVAIVVPAGGEAEATQALTTWPDTDRPMLISARSWLDVADVLSDERCNTARTGTQTDGATTTNEPANDNGSGRVPMVLLACLLLLASIAGAAYVYVGTPTETPGDVAASPSPAPEVQEPSDQTTTPVPGPAPVAAEAPGAALMHAPQPVPAPEPAGPAELAPGPVAVDLTLATARNCRAMQFGNRVHDTQRHVLAVQTMIAADAPVCGLAVTVDAGAREIVALVRVMVAAGPDEGTIIALARRSLAAGTSWLLPATDALDKQQEVRVDIIFQAMTTGAVPVTAELTADAFMAALVAGNGSHRAATFTRIAGRY